MTHDSAVRIVVNLVPEIEKRGAAQVLTEHARTEDLPPAQLEKLAQVYNTLRTVSYIDNADQTARGATVDLLDVPELVMSYATGSGREKSAARPIAFATHDSRVVDLNRALKSELYPDVEKAASSATAPMLEVDAVMQERIGREDVANALLDLELDIQDEMSKLAGAIFAAAPWAVDDPLTRDISEFEEEALRRQSVGAVKAAGVYMEKFAAPHRTKIVRFSYDEPVVKYAYEMPHENGERMARLAQLVGTYEIIKNAAETDELADDLIRRAIEEGESPDAGASFSFEPPNFDPEDTDIPDTDELIDSRVRDGRTTGTEKIPWREEESDKKRQGNSPDGEKGKGGKKESPLISIAAAPFAAIGGTVAAAKQKADETLSSIVSKERENKAQRSADMSVEDIKRAMNVRRLVGTDPVLREADPKLVFEVYNSIVAKNPDIAGDTAALRLILREAVSYEGLTLDAQKMLTEIRRNSAQGQKESDEVERKRYAVGGAVIPTKLKA
jgi:hypothetical protein